MRTVLIDSLEALGGQLAALIPEKFSKQGKGYHPQHAAGVKWANLRDVGVRGGWVKLDSWKRSVCSVFEADGGAARVRSSFDGVRSGGAETLLRE